MKKRHIWTVVGHTKGIMQKDRKLGVIRYVWPVPRAQALKRAKFEYPDYTVRVESEFPPRG